MSILAQLARAERIKAEACRIMRERMNLRGDIIAVESLDLEAETYDLIADMMEAEVRDEFAKDIADGAV